MFGVKLLVLVFTLSLTIRAVFSDEVTLDTLRGEIEILVRELEKSSKVSEQLTKQMGALSRQVMLQQLFVEERIRSDGQSGAKQIRHRNAGSRNYYSASYTGGSVLAIHSHSNNIRTVGLGEFVGVLNGVEFRTRHNDYRLYTPSTTDKTYHKTEPIPFPDVPPEVVAQGTLDEQAEELRQWFKAWRDGNTTHRDYQQYFKPVLCYLEGAWTKSTGNIEEPFESDRHFLDASSWFDLQEKVRFTAYTGRKNNAENFAYLPTTIMEMVNDTIAIYAQWNYRILCHPLKTDVPLNRLRMVDDLASRLSSHHTVEEQSRTRAARFQLNIEDSDIWKDGKAKFTFLDKLMSEIPGKDNYQAELEDDALDQLAYSMDPEIPDQVLNAGYYHRVYKVKGKDAMGVQDRRRSFSDTNVFMAMNTQDNIAGMKLTTCKGRGRKKKCVKTEQKWSYAIPLEMIYLTPLNKWNPHGILYRGDARLPEGEIASANGRNGQMSKEKAYDGVNSKIYYITPHEFFTGKETTTDAADTTRQGLGVLDASGNPVKVRASGIRVFFPNIPGVGTPRQRYPIMPVHAEGSATWKELEAVEDFLMDSHTHAHLFRQPLVRSSVVETNTDTRLATGDAPAPVHHHGITITKDDVDVLKNGGRVTVTTSAINEHQHEMVIRYRNEKFIIASCDGKAGSWIQGVCWDKHPKLLIVLPDQK